MWRNFCCVSHTEKHVFFCGMWHATCCKAVMSRRGNFKFHWLETQNSIIWVFSLKILRNENFSLHSKFYFWKSENLKQEKIWSEKFERHKRIFCDKEGCSLAQYLWQIFCVIVVYLEVGHKLMWQCGNGSKKIYSRFWFVSFVREKIFVTNITMKFFT